MTLTHIYDEYEYQAKIHTKTEKHRNTMDTRWALTLFVVFQIRWCRGGVTTMAIRRSSGIDSARGIGSRYDT